MLFAVICGWTLLYIVFTLLWSAICDGIANRIFLRGCIIITCLYVVMIIVSVIQNNKRDKKCEKLLFQEQEFRLQNDVKSAEIIKSTRNQLYC